MALRRFGIFFLRPVDLKEGVRVGRTQFVCFLVCRVLHPYTARLSS